MKLNLTARDTTVTHDGGQVHSYDPKGDRQAIAAMMKSRLFAGKAPRKEEV